MGKIYKLDFGSTEKETKTISELFDSIQFYRGEGRSVSEIHAALCRFGLWQKSLSSFANEYYQHRRQQQTVDVDDSKSAKPLQRSYFKNSSPANPGLPDSSLNSSKNEPVLEPEARTVIKPEMTLEQKREISARLFRERSKN